MMRFACPYTKYDSQCYGAPSSSRNWQHPSGYHVQRNHLAMKMTMSTSSTMTPRIHRKALRLPSKRHPGKLHAPGKLHQVGKLHSSGKGGAAHHHPGKLQNMSRGKAPQNVETSCDNSNDSGFGYDHMEISRSRFSSASDYGEASAYDHGDGEHQHQAKRFRMDFNMDNDDSNDTFMTTEIKKMSIMPPAVPIHRAMQRPQIPRRPPLATGPLMTQHSNVSRDRKVQLEILCQPETQHRARYQTEGSRGAVKDRDQHGFPIVQLMGYNKPTILQVFIGTDIGRVAPHMFYQACRVSGKNSTPCTEVKINGTLVIQIELEPAKDMKVICDCVGILKERNVDVEHRFPEQTGSRSKKKSTRCRMVFRTVITNDDNTTETLQICSQPIICTQPPGVPEISKMSFNSFPVTGGMELIILGKNFLKNTQIVFEKCKSANEDEYVTPNREFLQQIHLVCTVPPYYKQDIQEPVKIRLFIVSGKDDQSRKSSEPHEFTYLPINGSGRYFSDCGIPSGLSLCGDPSNRLGNHFLSDDLPRPVMLWRSNTDVKPKSELDLSMMPPPATSMSIGQRRPSASNSILPDPHTPPLTSLKSEIMDENSQGSESKYHITNENSMDSMDNVSIMRHREMAMRNLEIMNENSVGNDNSMDALSCGRRFISHNEESMHGMVSSQILARSLQPATTADANSGHLMASSQLSPQELKEVMDLRVKPPVCDLSQTHAPSLATISQFVGGSNNLPAQTAQSVENFFQLSKSNTISQHLQMQTESLIKTDQLIQSVAAAVFNPLPTANSTEVLYPAAQPTVPSISQIGASLTQLTEMIPHSNHSGNIIQTTGTSLTNQLLGQTIANNITATIANDIIKESQNNPTNFAARTEAALDSLLNNQDNKDTSLVMDTSTSSLLTSTPGTAKLDALVNSTVDTHMGSPPQPAPTISPLVLTSNEDTIMKQSSPNVPTNILSQAAHTSPISQDMMPNIRHNLNISQAQDIIMASQSSPNDMMLTSNPNQNSPPNQNNSPSHDIILNTQVPSNMMCQDNVMMGMHQATQAMNNNILNAALNATTQDLAVPMSEIMNNSSLMQSSPQDVHMTNKSPPVAVKNMILNAAAEILTSQQTPITESAMNALMTSATLLNENASPPAQPPMIITQAPSAPQTELQQQTDQQRINDALCQTNQQSALLDQHISSIMNQQTCMDTNMMASNVQQMLNAAQPRQYNVTTAQGSQSMMNNVSLPNLVENMVSQMNTESAQSTFPNQSQSAISASANQILNQELCNAVNQQIQQNYLQAVAHNQAVNQEMRNDGNFSTMTDNDLLSYIDPTSFDNVPIGQPDLNHTVKY